MKEEKSQAYDIETFKSLNIEKILDAAKQQNYISYYSIFSQEISQKSYPEESAEHKILKLFSTLCSMSLGPHNLQEPFSPLWQIDGKRSYILSDFSEDDLSFLENCLPLLKNCRIRARIADMLWTRNKKLISFAETAITEYFSIPLTEENMMHDGCGAWERGVFLAKKLGKKFEEFLNRARSNLKSNFDMLPYKENSYSLNIARLLFEVCNSKELADTVIKKLSQWGRLSFEKQSWYWARDFYDETLRWLKYFDRDNDAQISEIIYNKAMCWEKEGEQRTDSAMLSGAAFADALKTYRQIPRKYREVYNIDSKLKAIQSKMAQANQSMEAELIHFKTDGIDISKAVTQAKDKLRGKDPLTAIVIFANIYPKIKKKDLETQTEDSLKNSSLAALMPNKYYSRDGRLVAESPGLTSDTTSPDYQKTLHCKLMQLYGLQTSIIVNASILPALEIFNTEQLITENDLIELCEASPIVPAERSLFWGKGLFYGFKEQYIEAIHLLAPQVEHMIRMTLKFHNIKTSVVDSSGLENEMGLSSLLEIDGIENIIPQDIIFEIKCLLSDQPGPNLRNEIAHGLISCTEATSHNAVYFWWFCLKLIVNSLPIDLQKLNL